MWRSIHWAHVSRDPPVTRPIHWAYVGRKCPADTPIPTSASCQPNDPAFKFFSCQASSPSSKPLPNTTSAPFQKWAIFCVRPRWSFHSFESSFRTLNSSTALRQIQSKQLPCISTCLSHEHADSRRHPSLSGLNPGGSVDLVIADRKTLCQEK